MKDRKRLQDILDAIAAIERYQVSSYDEFAADYKTQDAVFFNLIVHGYDQVKLQIVWDILQRDLTALKIGVEEIFKKL